MHRCLSLAKQGAGYVAPNPMVGAVLVHNDRIIGEGYHEKFGEAHAEVNCIDQAVRNGHAGIIPQSTLYVSLEPCAHTGKTPPCTDLIIQHKIPRVVFGCTDPFKEVNGKGIEKLKAAGVAVVTGVLENECRELNKRFFTFHTQHRPFIILKWAQTADGKISGATNERLLISNEYSNRLVHKWRSEEAAILTGTNTALQDDPELTTRLWEGPSPVRLVVDRELKLPHSLKLFNRQVKTIVFNTVKHEEEDNLVFYQVEQDASLVHQIMNALYQLKLQSVLVEGGAKLLQSFIDEDRWDEARIITNWEMTAGGGLPAPVLEMKTLVETLSFGSDKIDFYRN